MHIYIYILTVYVFVCFVLLPLIIFELDNYHDISEHLKQSLVLDETTGLR